MVSMGKARGTAPLASPQRGKILDEIFSRFPRLFRAEAGVETQVLFPFPADTTQKAIEAAVSATDGGFPRLVNRIEGTALWTHVFVRSRAALVPDWVPLAGGRPVRPWMVVARMVASLQRHPNRRAPRCLAVSHI